MKTTLIITLFLIIGTISSYAQKPYDTVKNKDRLQPWSENPRYWQYKGKPFLLLGGSKQDNLFNHPEGLEEHLDLLKSVGGNYIRNTMSSRSPGNLWPYKKLNNGLYDMEQWNDEYWERFENLLKLCVERDIVVQIEVWDRFDYSNPSWADCPWNPGNNINYIYEESGFDKEYLKHPWSDLQPFFHSIPGMPRYYPRLDMIRDYQKKFVSKILSYSLQYGNILYCMNNETSTPAEWGQYWIRFIKKKASEQGLIVYATDMFDDAHKGTEAAHTPAIFNDTVHYLFADISQVNSRNFGDEHWNKLLWLMEQINAEKPRPANHTKIYGGGYKHYGTGGLEDGIERFWRNILAGSASSRFHRPDAGNGLNERAKACIKAARKLESAIKLWDIEPHMELLDDRNTNEAYLAAKPGEQYALYFTYGGSVDLNLSDANGAFTIRWISVTEGTWWGNEEMIEGGSVVKITAPFKGGWVAAIIRVS